MDQGSPTSPLTLLGQLIIAILITVSGFIWKSIVDKRRPSQRNDLVRYLENRVDDLEKRIDKLEELLKKEQLMSERRRIKLLEVSRLHNVNVDNLV